MGLFSLLLALASAQTTTTTTTTLAPCNLPSAVDGLNKCRIKDGWGTLDADSSSGLSLVIETKDAHTDIDRVNHSATSGEFTRQTKRYILPCKQAAGEKTVKMNVSRPSSFTAFGAEWLKLFPKDSWKNVTNEYEPYMFNKYGAKIPIFRASDNSENINGPVVTSEDNVAVYMVVDDIGDYEVMYGNPGIFTPTPDTVTESGATVACVVTPTEDCKRWVAVRFLDTLLRVGSPWAECSGTDTDLPAARDGTEIGAILPALFGHPNLNLQEYKDLADDVRTTTVPVKVVLQIFTDTVKNYTMSEESYTPQVEHPKGLYTKCYEAGNACPEGHSVCRSSYCEMDTWEAIITDLKSLEDGTTNPLVTVLGMVGSGTVSGEYTRILDTPVDGFYFTEGSVLESVAGYSVYATGEPLLNESFINDTDTYVTLIGDNVGVWNPFSWYKHTPPSKWAAIVDSVATQAAMESTLDALFDRGYGWVFVTDKTGDDTSFGTRSSFNTELFLKIFGKMGDVPNTARRLDEEKKAYSWGCDDTGYHCAPVCLEQTGPVTTIARNELCADKPVDPCKCKCYYEVEWVCDGGRYVCEASKGIERMIVGDLLCENRGTPKPNADVLEIRQASECPTVKTTRGEWPAQQCLVQWATPAPEPEVEEVEEPDEQQEQEQEQQEQQDEDVSDEDVSDEDVSDEDVSDEQDKGPDTVDLVVIQESSVPVAAFALAALLQ